MADLATNPKGEAVRQKLWNETMDEFAFANAKQILQSLSSK